jgi:hypothetical protein
MIGTDLSWFGLILVTSNIDSAWRRVHCNQWYKEWLCEGCGKFPCFPGSAVDGSNVLCSHRSTPRNCSTYSEKNEMTRECGESLVLWEVDFPTQYWLSSPWIVDSIQSGVMLSRASFHRYCFLVRWNARSQIPDASEVVASFPAHTYVPWERNM